MIISDVSNLIISSNNFEIDLPSIVNNSPVLTSALEIPHSYKSSEMFFDKWIAVIQLFFFATNMPSSMTVPGVIILVIPLFSGVP